MAKARSGHVKVRYCNPPMILLKLVASFSPSRLPICDESFSVVPIGVLTTLQELMLALLTKSIAYFSATAVFLH
jgi:hypothetical protein